MRVGRGLSPPISDFHRLPEYSPAIVHAHPSCDTCSRTKRAGQAQARPAPSAECALNAHGLQLRSTRLRQSCAAVRAALSCRAIMRARPAAVCGQDLESGGVNRVADCAQSWDHLLDKDCPPNPGSLRHDTVMSNSLRISTKRRVRRRRGPGQPAPRQCNSRAKRRGRGAASVWNVTE